MAMSAAIWPALNGISSGRPPMNIAILDDDEAYRNLLEMRIRKLKPDSKISLSDSITNIDDADLIFQDIFIPPYQDGETIAQARKKFTKATIIAMSGSSKRTVPFDIFLAGADDYFSKDIMEKNLERILNNVRR